MAFSTVVVRSFTPEIKIRFTASQGVAAARLSQPKIHSISRNTVTSCFQGKSFVYRRQLRVFRKETSLLAKPEGANEAQESNEEEVEDESPGMILRVTRGTTFMGLLAARRAAKAEAEGDQKRLEKIEWAFKRLIEASEDRFKKAIEDEPESVAAIYNYANFLQTIEDFDAAENMYRKVLDLDESNADALNNLAMLLHEQKGDLDGADKLYESLIEKSPEDIDALFNWALLKKDGFKDMEGANKLIDRIVAINPGMAEHDLVVEFRC